MSETLPYIYKYPTDLSGLHPTNQVLDELVRVYQTDKGPYVGVPAYAPFFTDNMTVFTEDGVELLPERDYRAIYLNEDLTNKSPKEICSAIYVTATLPYSDVPGHEHRIKISYRTVGYPYTHMVGTMAYLMEQLNNDQRPVEWGKLIDTPNEYRPEHHLHPAGDLYGFEHVVARLEEIRNALIGVYAFNNPDNIPYTQQDRQAVLQAIAKLNEALTRVDTNEYKVDTFLGDMADVFGEDLFGDWLPGVVRLEGPLTITTPTTEEYHFSGVPDGATVVIESDVNAWFSAVTDIDPTDTVSFNAAPAGEGTYTIVTYAVKDGKRSMKHYQTLVVDYG